MTTRLSTTKIFKMNTQITVIAAMILAMSISDTVHGHGRLMDPPSRMSAWRLGFLTPVEYTDNEQNCGGFNNQWFRQDGKCGMCGDPFQGPERYLRPSGSMVPSLVITKKYTQGSIIEVTVQITASHLGWHEFRICDTRETNGIEATFACLNSNLLADESGQTRFPQGPEPGFLTQRLVLPPGLSCPQCVLQWKWHCGNNLGLAQEEFYGCSDVTINPSTDNTFTPPTQPTPESTLPPQTQPTRPHTPGGTNLPPVTPGPTPPPTPQPTPMTREPLRPWNDLRLSFKERLESYKKDFYKSELMDAWSRGHIKSGGQR